MIKQNKTKLQFILLGIFIMSVAFAGCNGSGDTKEPVKDTTVVNEPPPPPPPRDSVDTMEGKTGKVAPVVDTKPKQ